MEQLDEVVHQRVRLGILAMLANRPKAGFTSLRDALGQPDSGLSRHLRVLEDAELVTTDKVIEDRRPKTWVAITDAGRSALNSELAALRTMITAIESGAADSMDLAILLGDGKPTKNSALRELVVDEMPDGFVVTKDVEVDDHYRLQDGGGWDSQRGQALAFRSHGLKGGRFRSWSILADGHLLGSAHVMLVELGSKESTLAILNTFATSTLPLDFEPARCYLLDRDGKFPKSGVCWLASGPYLVCVSVVGDEAMVSELTPKLARAQHSRLASG